VCTLWLAAVRQNARKGTVSTTNCAYSSIPGIRLLLQVIIAGLYTAFSAKQQLTSELLISEVQDTQPLSVTRAEEVQSIRDWAKHRAVLAD
jgi:hypothetical protein